MANETNVSNKQTDSAYSNSCSNQSQSQRSGSTKSRLSGSHSSGSSGYGGKHTQLKETSSTENSSSQKWDKEKARKKKKIKTSTSGTGNNSQDQSLKNNETIEINENNIKCSQTSPQWQTMKLKGHTLNLISSENFEQFDNSHEINESESGNISSPIQQQPPTPKQTEFNEYKIEKTKDDVFRCVISMHDGIVLFTTPNIIDLLEFPKDMWLGRSFIDFVHPKDRAILANTITTPIQIAENKINAAKDIRFSLHVMLRKYRGLLSGGYNVTGNTIEYAPFWMNLIFKDVPPNTKGEINTILNDATMLLVISAVPIKSAYKTSNETNLNNLKFSVRHSAAGIISQIDGSYATAVGYFSQDILGKTILDFYNTEDLPTIRNIYEQIIQKTSQPGGKYISKPYRFLIQNGSHVMLETEWTSFINPWTRKLEFITGNHRVVQGPEDCDIFKSFQLEHRQNSQESIQKSNMIKEEILKLLSQSVERPTDNIKHEVSKRCQDLATFMENLMEEVPDLKLDVPHENDLSMSERGSVMLGEISPHHDYYCDSKSSSETPLSYNQLNYNENIQRFFNSKPLTSSPEEQQCFNETDSKSPIHCSNDSGGSSNLTSDSSACPDQTINFNDDETRSHMQKLTEVLMVKHNEEMEKNMLKKHRELRNRFGDKIKKNQEKQEKQEQLNHGIKRCGSFTWEGGEAYKTTKHQNYCEGQRDSLEANNIRTYSNSRGLIDKLSFQQFSRNIDLWPPFSVSLTTMQSSQIPTNSKFTSPSRFVYYFPQNPIVSAEAKPNEINHQPYPLQSMSKFMYSHPELFYVQPSNNIYSQMPAQTLTTSCLDFPFQSKLLTSHDSHTKSKNQSQSAHSKVNQWQKNTDEGIFKSESNLTSLKAETGSSFCNSSNNNQSNDDSDESSFSSFYSSFVKTDGSSDAGQHFTKSNDKKLRNVTKTTKSSNRVWRRQEPPWINNVSITPELIFNYKLKNKNITDILKNDLKSLNQLKQPILVNDQLEQLYADLDLEGSSTNLYLSETSSANSDDDDSITLRRERLFRNKKNATMIYEENCPLPSPVM